MCVANDLYVGDVISLAESKFFTSFKGCYMMLDIFTVSKSTLKPTSSMRVFDFQLTQLVKFFVYEKRDLEFDSFLNQKNQLLSFFSQIFIVIQ